MQSQPDTTFVPAEKEQTDSPPSSMKSSPQKLDEQPLFDDSHEREKLMNEIKELGAKKLVNEYEIQTLEKESEKLKQTLEEERKKADALFMEWQKLRQETKDFLFDFDASHYEQLMIKGNENQSKHAKIRFLKQQYRDYKEKFRKIVAFLQHMKQELDVLMNERNDYVKELDRDKEVFKIKLENLAKQREESDNEIKLMRKEYIALQNEIIRIEGEIQAKKNKMQRIVQHYDQEAAKLAKSLLK